jgi:hypothetical protein
MMTDSDTPSARQTRAVLAKTSPPWIKDVDSFLVALKARHDCHDCLDCLTRLLLLLEPLLESLRKEIWRQEAAHSPPNYTVDDLRGSTWICVHLYTRYVLSWWDCDIWASTAFLLGAEFVVIFRPWNLVQAKLREFRTNDFMEF